MKNKPCICAIVAVGPDNVIGQNGVMPWHCQSDLQHFKKITTPHPCIFGRTTFENLPYKPLPNRLNLVCSSKYSNKYQDGVFYANSLESALNETLNYSKVFICGGAQIYKYAFDQDFIDVLYLTIIKNKNLEYNVRQNPNSYCRFQPNISEFFNSNKWHSEQIFYTKNVLPKDTNDTHAIFYKFEHIR